MKIVYNQKFDSQLLALVNKNKYGYYGKLQKCKDLKYLDDYIFQCTVFLDETEKVVGKKFATRAVRVFYTLKHIDHQLTCCVCGKPYIISKGFSITEKSNVDIEHLHCCHLCAMNDPLTQSRITDTFIDHYGCKSCFQAEPVKRKIEDTNEYRYGVKQFSQSKRYLEIGEANNWWPETEQQRKSRGLVLRETLAKKSDKEKAESSQKAKNTCLQRYGVENWSQTKEYKKLYADKDWAHRKKAKEINTKIKNGTTNTSKSEKMAYDQLVHKFGIDNVIPQYKDKRYPFFCDFYIRSLDLFIELNEHWTHGNGLGFFDEHNPTHQTQLQKWKTKANPENKKDFYTIAIKVWTQTDLLKVKTAIERGLHYLVFWTYSELKAWLS